MASMLKSVISIAAIEAALAVNATTTAYSQGPCQPGSIPFDQCNFNSKYEMNSCVPAANTGSTAKPNTGICVPPSSNNRCTLQFDNGKFMWRSDRAGVNCCNCFQAYPQDYCPPNTLPEEKCDFHNDQATNACLKSVNYGQLAARGGGCTIPDEHSDCVMEFISGSPDAWTWVRKNSNQRCCNCWQTRAGTWPEANNADAAAAALNQQADSRPVKQLADSRPVKHLRRKSAAMEGDATSMLQLPEDFEMGDEEDLVEVEEEL